MVAGIVFYKHIFLFKDTVDPRFLDFGDTAISKRRSDPCFNIEI